MIRLDERIEHQLTAAGSRELAATHLVDDIYVGLDRTYAVTICQGLPGVLLAQTSPSLHRDQRLLLLMMQTRHVIRHAGVTTREQLLAGEQFGSLDGFTDSHKLWLEDRDIAPDQLGIR